MKLLQMATLPKNVCGDCTLCCKVLAIAELAKPISTWCVHAHKRGGCDIYDTKPESCNNFVCGWIKWSLGAGYRPDKIHGVISDADVNSFCIHEDPGWPGHASAALQHEIDRWLSFSPKNFVVVITGVNSRLIAHPGRHLHIVTTFDELTQSPFFSVEEDLTP